MLLCQAKLQTQPKQHCNCSTSSTVMLPSKPILTARRPTMRPVKYPAPASLAVPVATRMAAPKQLQFVPIALPDRSSQKTANARLVQLAPSPREAWRPHVLPALLVGPRLVKDHTCVYQPIHATGRRHRQVRRLQQLEPSVRIRPQLPDSHVNALPLDVVACVLMLCRRPPGTRGECMPHRTLRSVGTNTRSDNSSHMHRQAW